MLSRLSPAMILPICLLGGCADPPPGELFNAEKVAFENRLRGRVPRSRPRTRALLKPEQRRRLHRDADHPFRRNPKVDVITIGPIAHVTTAWFTEPMVVLHVRRCSELVF